MGVDMSCEWTEPVTINDAGTRCVVETNWEDLEGKRPRCQVIYERQPDGGCLVTTCRRDVPPVRYTAEQCSAVAYFLRATSPDGPAS